MTERERAINRDLHVLDEAHRLGRLSRAEYRARRRRVLQALRDGNSIVIACRTLAPSDAITTPRACRAHVMSAGDTFADTGRALTILLSIRPAMAWKPLLAILAGVILLVLAVGWFVFAG
ncbi:hypothetical protein RHOFW104T7_08030 [Rhodanobacter thiooxydans]|uniref:Uncharacterized protein n=1 Tax=Rhodanobacter thiooxydans TaxID=416169 RepID=A0A154QJQ4_9GAMM|nr:hypothetical protein [Rhodanobacter thiooxydans]EIM02967.1 hypothetical protein UUA_00685 [Rhodanobacter thiooxydans LCS2]KZC24546.1 hypothetical protein RHOFW104T7_08030 [Rhodanobacter thiooxydans]MCW0203313.1 hypothetical protein [Rhodanobacter thiooxydans]